MRVALIDDHPLVREGLAVVLELDEEMDIIWQAESMDEAVKNLIEDPPDIALVDLRLRQGDGLDVIRKAKEKINGNCKFIVLTSSTDSGDLKAASELGVEGYISKEALPEEILTSIKLIKQGRKYYDPGLVQDLMQAPKNGPFNELTEREMQVLRALGRGLNNRAIAEELVVTEYTVKKHVGRILDKLYLEDRTQVALLAAKEGMV